MLSILFVVYAVISGAYCMFGRIISVSTFADGSFDEGSFGWSFAALTSLLMLHIYHYFFLSNGGSATFEKLLNVLHYYY